LLYRIYTLLKSMNIPEISYPSEPQICAYLNSIWDTDIDHKYSWNSYETTRHINEILTFPERKWYYGKHLDISIGASEKQGHTLEIHNHQQSSLPLEIPLSLENISSWFHTIDAELQWVIFGMLEHILGVLEGLNIYGSKIIVDASKWGMSWPMEETSVQKYYQELSEKSTEQPSNQKISTVSFPTLVKFDNKHSGSALLLPDAGAGVLRIESCIDYPDIHILWKKRIGYELGDTNIFEKYISTARSNAFGKRNIIVNTPVCIKNFAQRLFTWEGMLRRRPFWVHKDQVLQFWSEQVQNPKQPFIDHDIWAISEILYHGTLDKIAPYALRTEKQVGTHIYNKTGHREELIVQQLIDSWKIATQEVSASKNTSNLVSSSS